MPRKLPFFEQNSEPLERRVATGLQKVGLALKHQAWKQANEEGLSPTQGQVLALLAEQSLSSSEIAARIGVSLPTISDSVRVLGEKGLLSRAPDPRHPRASLLSLTKTGKHAVAKISDWPDFLSSAVGAMSREEQAVFLSGLMKMITALQASGQIPLQRMCVNCTYFRPNAHEGEYPHHCAFVDAPMRAEHLRLDCDEHVAAS